MKKFLKGFVYAFRGIVAAAQGQLNFRVHLLACALATTAGFYLGLEHWEWVAVILSMGLVLMAELLNTALEELVNMVSPEWNEKAGRIKDLAAGAVLATAIAAAIVGVVIFGGRIWGCLVQ